MKTPLYERHCQLGARFVDFSGWQMPLYYSGILEEHRTVRSAVGLFDISHMGRVLFQGGEAEAFVDYLSTNKIAGKKEGTATYTLFTNREGGCVDDALVYKESPTDYFTVVNAANRQKDLTHFLKIAALFKHVSVIPRYDEEGMLAVQGPQALLFISELFPETAGLAPFHFMAIEIDGHKILLSRTGYTGEEGVEIFAPLDIVPTLWDLLMQKGRRYQIRPIGLGARDTLRLEMGYALYGHELSETISPLESVSAWTVKLKQRNFIGKEALQALKKSGKKRSAGALLLEGEGIARQGYPVFSADQQIGVVTSGTQSPSCRKAIALVLTDRELHEGEEVTVQIRQKRCPARVVVLPFYKKTV